MFDNLETIKAVTQESIELRAKIKSEIESILTLGLFDNSDAKQKHWQRIKQLAYNEESVLLQIENVQSYFANIIEELEKVKPSKHDIKHRKQMMDNFIHSMNKSEYTFASKADMTREIIEEYEVGFVKSVINKVRGIFSKDKVESIQVVEHEVIDTVVNTLPEKLIAPKNLKVKG